MTAEEFWNKDSCLAEAYRDADIRMRQRQNFFIWLQGQYVYDAMAAVMHNAFSKKGTTPLKYTAEPYRITPPTKEEMKAEAERERQKAIKSLNSWKAAWDKAYG